MSWPFYDSSEYEVLTKLNKNQNVLAKENTTKYEKVDDKSNCDLDFKCELQKRRKKGGQRH